MSQLVLPLLTSGELPPDVQELSFQKSPNLHGVCRCGERTNFRALTDIFSSFPTMKFKIEFLEISYNNKNNGLKFYWGLVFITLEAEDEKTCLHPGP